MSLATSLNRNEIFLIEPDFVATGVVQRLEWWPMKISRWIILLAVSLSAACIGNLYSKPTPSTSEDVATLSEQYVKATRAGMWDFTAVIPSKVIHPKDGYIDYERLWCLDKSVGSVDDYLSLIEKVCELRSGAMQGEWCVGVRSGLPLFSATMEYSGAQCTGGDPAAVIHTLEPISSPSAFEWRLFAEMMGFKKPS